MVYQKKKILESWVPINLNINFDENKKKRENQALKN